jgi:hypothetical protein
MQTFLKKQKNQDYHIWIKKNATTIKKLTKKNGKEKGKKRLPQAHSGLACQIYDLVMILG